VSPTLAAVQLTSLISPLLTSAAAWAIAVWALRQDASPLTPVLRTLAGRPEDGSNPHAGSA
jgi:hypothetical protein